MGKNKFINSSEKSFSSKNWFYVFSAHKSCTTTYTLFQLQWFVKAGSNCLDLLICLTTSKQVSQGGCYTGWNSECIDFITLLQSRDACLQRRLKKSQDGSNVYMPNPHPFLLSTIHMIIDWCSTNQQQQQQQNKLALGFLDKNQISSANQGIWNFFRLQNLFLKNPETLFKKKILSDGKLTIKWNIIRLIINNKLKITCIYIERYISRLGVTVYYCVTENYAWEPPFLEGSHLEWILHLGMENWWHGSPPLLWVPGWIHLRTYLLIPFLLLQTCHVDVLFTLWPCVLQLSSAILNFFNSHTQLCRTYA